MALCRSGQLPGWTLLRPPCSRVPSVPGNTAHSSEGLVAHVMCWEHWRQDSERIVSFMRPLLLGDCWVLSIRGHRAIYGFRFEKRARGPLRGTFALALSVPAGSHSWTHPSWEWVFQLILLLHWNKHSRTLRDHPPTVHSTRGTPQSSWELVPAHHLCTFKIILQTGK